jgi:dephospho-CoA kinase
MMVIGISGLAGAGKSTVARRLRFKYGARYHLSLAATTLTGPVRE